MFKKILVLVIIAIVAIASVMVITSAYQTVQSGYMGVVLSWGNPVRTVSAGMNLITPIVEDIVEVNVQVQSATVSDESAASKDLQEVRASVTINYQLDSAYTQQIYTELRNEYQSRVVEPLMKDAIKASTAKFQATELITNRETVKLTLQTLLDEKLDQYHINVVSVSITNLDFSDSFMAAIEAKVTAEQNALAAQNQLLVVQYQAQQQIIQANAAANATIATAQGNAQAQIINANATAQAIQIVNAQLTPEYIEYLYAMGWDGQLPTTWVSGNSTSPFLMLNP